MHLIRNHGLSCGCALTQLQESPYCTFRCKHGYVRVVTKEYRAEFQKHLNMSHA